MGLARIAAGKRLHAGHSLGEKIAVLGQGISSSLGGEAGLHSLAMAPPPPPSAPPPDPDLQTGLQYLRAGWFDRAEPLFRSALARYGDRPDILHFLAVCLAQRGAFVEAEGMWRKAVAKDPNEPMLTYNLGLVAKQLGRLDEATRRFKETIRKAPNHVEARLALAALHIESGRFAAAESELGECVYNLDQVIQKGNEAVKPVQARARNMLGHAL